MPKYSMYQFDQETWVITVKNHVDDSATEYCVCSEYLEQLSSAKERAEHIVKILNKAAEKEWKKNNKAFREYYNNFHELQGEERI